MTRLLLTLAAAAALLAPAPAAPVPAHLPADGPLYFPTRVGTEWVYDENGTDVTRVVTEVEAKDGTWVVTFAVVRPDGETTPDGKFVVSKAGLSRLGQYGAPCEPPVRAVNLPYRPGEAWTFEFKVGGAVTTGRKVARKLERVTVPAGTFMAAPIETEFAVNGQKMPRATFWYAPGVGMVKRQDDKSTTVLKKFVAGKD